MSKETDIFKGFSILNDDVIAPGISDANPDAIVIPSMGDGIVSEVEPGSTQGEVIIPTTIKYTKNEETSEETEKGLLEEPNEAVEDFTPIKILAEFLAEKAIVSIPEDFEDYSEEGIVTLVDGSIKKGIEEYKASKSETAKQLLEFLDNGGRVEDFIDAYSGTSYNDIQPDTLTTNTELAKQLVGDLLASQGYTPEEIVQEVEDYVDGGILANKAKRALTKLQAIQEDQKENLVQLQAKQKQAQVESEKQFFVKLKSDIESQEELLGFKLTPTEKNQFYDYITKVDKKTGKTALQLDTETIENAQMKQAYMLFKKFNVESVQKQATKKASTTLLQKLGKSNAKASNYSAKQGSGNVGGDFSAFVDLLKV